MSGPGERTRGPAGPPLSISRVIASWTLIAGVETLHGVARALFLVPVIGDLRARQAGVAIGSMLILGAAWLTVPWIGIRMPWQAIQVGAIWVALMLAFELALGRALGMTWDRLLADYNPAEGGFMLAGMAVLLMAPWLAGRARRLF